MSEELKIIIAAETAKLRNELNKAQKEVEKLKDKGKASFKEFNEELQKVGNGAKKSLAVMGGAIAGAATALLALGGSTAEYRQQQGLLKSAFEAAGGSATEAKNTYNDLYRVLGDTGKATEAAAHLGKLTTNQEELSQWTNICQGVYATFGDSLPIEGLTEAVNHTAKLGEVQGVLADAIEWSGGNVDAFNEQLAACNSESEREKLIRDTLNGIYSEAATNYETNNAAILAQNEANQKMSDTLAKVGEAVAPINTALTSLAADVLAQLEPYITQFAEEYLPAITEALSGVGEAIGKVIMWIADNWELVSTLAAIIAGISAALAIFSTVMGIVNAVMAASPVTWIVLGIVAAVTALVAIIVLCIKYWDEIKATAVGIWDAILGAIDAAVNWIKNLFNKIVSFVKENWQGLLLMLVNPFAGAFKILYDNCDGFREFIDNLVQKIGAFFANMWNGLKDGAKQAWDGVVSIFSKVTTFFKDIFSKAWSGVKSVFTTGGQIFQGIKEGITSVFKTVVNSIIRGINKVISVPFNAINSALSRIKNISIAGISPFSWITTFNVPQIPELEKGGVLKRGQIGLLEGNGAEAVVPLENNLGWLNKLATMLSDRLDGTNGNTPIVLNVDGKVFAETAVNTLNARFRQTGKMDLIYI